MFGPALRAALLSGLLLSLPAPAEILRGTPAAVTSLPGPDGLLPGAAALYETMAIPAARGEAAHFVIGDNIAGYYEGRSGLMRGDAGYRLKQETLLAGFAGFRDGQLLRRETAEAQILPWGLRAEYPGLREELLVHTGRQALSLRLSGESPAHLALQPLWNLAAQDYLQEILGKILLLSPKTPATDGIPRFIALFAEQDLAVENPAKDKALGMTPGVLGFRLASTKPLRQLTLHIVFAPSRAAALSEARALAGRDTWNEVLATRYRQLTRSHLWTPDATYNRALLWAKASAMGFLSEEYGPGLWAGLPWFRDNWGRDTFIALPGTLLISGRFREARAVLENFARRQKLQNPADPEYGRIPNRVADGQETLYNTVDGTPWLLREALEYLRYSGDDAFAEKLLPLAREYLRGVQAHWLDKQGFLRHEDADTWMDARIAGKEAWSPRGDRVVEIQALWHTALAAAAELAMRAGQKTEAENYRRLADRVQANFLPQFWDGQTMADHLRADGSRDTRLRPNGLMLISVPFSPFVPETVEARVLKRSVGRLLYPEGILSLDPADPAFHPRHENPAFHHKDAAYHNGTIWGWNAGFTVTALNKYGQQDLAWKLSRNLAGQILNIGTRGAMSELVDALPDAKGKPKPSGTYAQAWSVAEFARNAYQDYLGFRPNILEGRLHFVPALPGDWNEVQARLPYGEAHALDLYLEHRGDTWRWRFIPDDKTSRMLSLDLLTDGLSRVRVEFPLQGRPRELRWNGREAFLDGEPLPARLVMPSQAGLLGLLEFARPPAYRPQDFPVLRGQDVLKRAIIEDSRLPAAPRSHKP
ncbi:MAG: glycogen debranching protein [Gammaproteobacteria bacterium]|nr:glycogen debranching protein [Gammaproteobacteria bacterium]